MGSLLYGFVDGDDIVLVYILKYDLFSRQVRLYEWQLRFLIDNIATIENTTATDINHRCTCDDLR